MAAIARWTLPVTYFHSRRGGYLPSGPFRSRRVPVLERFGESMLGRRRRRRQHRFIR